MIKALKDYRFLLSRLVKRDFIQKYKKTALGIIWSVMNPLCELMILMLVFKNIFGRDTPYYTTYVIIGILTYNYYSNATTQGMESLLHNSGIINKIKLPTWLFPLSKNISATMNFLITCVVMVLFILLDHITITWKILLLVYPYVLMFFFNLGVSLILSSIYVFFKDTSYLFHIFNRLLYYCCAIFWTVEHFPEKGQALLKFNPIYDFIFYTRTIIIDGQIPGLDIHLIMLAYTVAAVISGMIVFHFNKKKFIFYI